MHFSSLKYLIYGDSSFFKPPIFFILLFAFTLKLN